MRAQGNALGMEMYRNGQALKERANRGDEPRSRVCRQERALFRAWVRCNAAFTRALPWAFIPHAPTGLPVVARIKPAGGELHPLQYPPVAPVSNRWDTG
jgi:hypothetical protein